MSLRKLVSVSRRYRNPNINQQLHPPITGRRSTDESDETDTDSIATSISDDAVTDDGTDFPVDHRVRALRRREAQARINGTLQYAHGRVNDGIRPVRHFANEIVEDGDFLYNDVARPVFDEALFKIQVFVTVVFRLLLRLVWFILTIPERFIGYVLDLIGSLLWLVLAAANSSFWFALDLLRVSFWFVLDLFRHSLWFVLGLVQASFNLAVDLLRQVYIVLRNFQWKPIAVIIGSGMIIVSLLHGFVSTAIHICGNDPMAQRWTGLPDVCRRSNLVATLRYESMEVARLSNTSNAILYGIANIGDAVKPNLAPSHNLLTESSALLEFARTHEENLTPFSQQYDIVQVTEAIHDIVTAYNRATERFTHEQAIQTGELGLKARNIMTDAKKFTAQTPAQHFFLESISFFLPSAFSYSDAARQNARYVAMTSHFLTHPQTTSVLQQAVETSQNAYDMREGLQIAQKALSQYEPFWRIACSDFNPTSRSDHTRCHEDPSELNRRLDNALRNSQATADSIAKLHGLHRTLNGAMETLRSDLTGLLRAAGGHKTGSIGVKASSARAILQQFVIQVGSLGFVLGAETQVVGIKLGPGNVRGSVWTVGPDGLYTPRPLHPHWERGSFPDE